MLLKSFKQLFSKPKIKGSAWDGADSGRRFFHFQPELGSINLLQKRGNGSKIEGIARK